MKIIHELDNVIFNSVFSDSAMFLGTFSRRLCQSLFSYKVAGLKPATLLEKRLWHKCYSLIRPKNMLEKVDEIFFE